MVLICNFCYDTSERTVLVPTLDILGNKLPWLYLKGLNLQSLLQNPDNNICISMIVSFKFCFYVLAMKRRMS